MLALTENCEAQHYHQRYVSWPSIPRCVSIRTYLMYSIRWEQDLLWISKDESEYLENSLCYSKQTAMRFVARFVTVLISTLWVISCFRKNSEIFPCPIWALVETVCSRKCCEEDLLGLALCWKSPWSFRCNNFGFLIPEAQDPPKSPRKEFFQACKQLKRDSSADEKSGISVGRMPSAETEPYDSIRKLWPSWPN